MSKTKEYTIVCIPADNSEALQEWNLKSSEEELVESLLDRLKTHFSATGSQKTAAQLAKQHADLAKTLPAGTHIDENMLHVATSMQMVENIALLSNAPEHGFVGVNMYVDDEGSIKELPLNVRASDIAMCCGKALEVRGDAFLSRVLDDGDNFDRLDLTISEVSSLAKWVRDAAEQNRRKQRDSGAGQQFADRLQQQSGLAVSTAGGTSAVRQPPPPPPQSPAQQAKAAGNKAFAAGRWEEAIKLYTKAVQEDLGMVSALNNRALCHLKLQQFDRAEADSTAVLQLEPQNVKALLRRANAREALQQAANARADYEAVLAIEPNNKEAQSRLSTFDVPVTLNMEQVQEL